MTHQLLLATVFAVLATAAWAAPSGPYPSDLPFIGKGECGEVSKGEDGFYRVKCWGPPETLAPGETRNVMVELANPYVGSELYSVVNMTAQLVDEDGRPVPLSEVYVHHYVAQSSFLLGSGAELRGGYDRAPLAWPLTLQVNGSETAHEKKRVTNVQLINTVGVAAADLRACLECWCWDSAPAGGLPVRGSFLCCSNCPSSAPKDGPTRAYRLEYGVVYRPMAEAANAAAEAPRVVGFLGFDSTGGKVEYDLLEPLGPNTTHHEVYETTIDHACPQAKPFTIVRCTAHQHVGSRCLTVYNMDKDDEVICRSCPIFGTEEGVPGNEKGYVVAITDDNVSYEIAPRTRIRLSSDYDGSERRLGLMGLMSMWAADLDESTCTGQFGHSYGYASALAAGHSMSSHPARAQPVLSTS